VKVSASLACVGWLGGLSIRLQVQGSCPCLVLPHCLGGGGTALNLRVYHDMGGRETDVRGCGKGEGVALLSGVNLPPWWEAGTGSVRKIVPFHVLFSIPNRSACCVDIVDQVGCKLSV
jgi:hypothetical protein